MASGGTPCSVVLEGGVTSAVIYTGLLARLSRHCVLRQLGGASSGAAAAAAGAAAEFARWHGDSQAQAFVALGEFPDRLASVDRVGRTMLLRLFQPTPRARAPFAVAMAALDGSGRTGPVAAVARVGRALVANFEWAALLAALVVAAAGWIMARWVSSLSFCGTAIDQLLVCSALWAALLLPTVLGAALVFVGWALTRTVRALRANHWGLCHGMGESGFERDPALTPALHELYQRLAGPRVRGPLTLGDLWWGPQPPDGSPRPRTDERRIDLQVVTTLVSQQRPLRLPGDPGTDPLREFFYDPGEWATLFPADVMAHLRARARPVTLRHDDGRELLALPEPEHWPVLMVARFSLSFPLLLSAVPMYAVVPRRDVLRAGAAAGKQPFEARKVYFSDGGITSNCPVHLFDAPLPRFPNFGVNLYERPRGSGMRVSRSDSRDPSLDAAAMPDPVAWTSPLPLLWAIVSTALGWRDSLQRSLPGYRERIVHIGLPPDAGGLNLAMTPTTIVGLAAIGRHAARKLRDDFATPRRSGEPNAWERHRWTRARITLSALHAHLEAFAQCVPSGEPDYRRLLRHATPERHAFADEAARQQALDLMDGTAELVPQLGAMQAPDAPDGGTPRPRPDLHLSPPW